VEGNFSASKPVSGPCGEAEHEEGQVIGEVQRGYKLGDRVLRPALVRVAKGKPVSEAESD